MTKNSNSKKNWLIFILEQPELPIYLIGLSLTFLSAIPTWISWFNSRVFKVRFDEGKIAQDRDRSWSDNIGCFGNMETFQTRSGIGIQILECKNQNISITLRIGNISYIRWINANSDSNKKNLLGLGQLKIAANVSEPTILAQAYTVICQRRLSQTRVIRRIRNNSTGQCFDQIINTGTGQVVSENPASSCNRNCQ